MFQDNPGLLKYFINSAHKFDFSQEIKPGLARAILVATPGMYPSLSYAQRKGYLRTCDVAQQAAIKVVRNVSHDPCSPLWKACFITNGGTEVWNTKVHAFMFAHLRDRCKSMEDKVWRMVQVTPGEQLRQIVLHHREGPVKGKRESIENMETVIFDAALSDHQFLWDLMDPAVRQFLYVAYPRDPLQIVQAVYLVTDWTQYVSWEFPGGNWYGYLLWKVRVRIQRLATFMVYHLTQTKLAEKNLRTLWGLGIDFQTLPMCIRYWIKRQKKGRNE